MEVGGNNKDMYNVLGLLFLLLLFVVMRSLTKQPDIRAHCSVVLQAARCTLLTAFAMEDMMSILLMVGWI